MSVANAERNGDMPEPWMIELIRTPDPRVIERLGKMAAETRQDLSYPRIDGSLLIRL